jgi:Protein of unknown function (DUF3306)
MSEDENVLARWSRRKTERARRDGKKQAPEDAETFRPAQPDPTDACPSPVFDVSTLPPLESIVAGSDVRAFLQAGVPATLTRAALRRAWSSDPAIRDFIEMAENQWDFANPDTIPGFGSLTSADDIPQLVARALGERGDDQQAIAEGYAGRDPTHPTEKDPESSPAVRSEPDADFSDAASNRASTPLSEREMARAPQQNEDTVPSAPQPGPRRRRGHGGALPS